MYVIVLLYVCVDCVFVCVLEREREMAGVSVSVSFPLSLCVCVCVLCSCSVKYECVSMYFLAGVSMSCNKLIITHASSLNCSNVVLGWCEKVPLLMYSNPKIFSKCTDYRDHCSFLPSFQQEMDTTERRGWPSWSLEGWQEEKLGTVRGRSEDELHPHPRPLARGVSGCLLDTLLLILD